jgi:carboxyl-terminal processing protease
VQNLCRNQAGLWRKIALTKQARAISLKAQSSVLFCSQKSLYLFWIADQFRRKEISMKQSKTLLWVSFFLMFLTPACAPVTPGSTPTAIPTTTVVSLPTVTETQQAQQYLSDALEIIQKNALNSKKVDWEKVRSTAFDLEKEAKAPQDTYDTISYVLQQLQDHHSFFLTPDAANQMDNSTVEDYLQPKGLLIKNRIGDIAVFAFDAQSEKEVNKYADEIQNIIIDLHKQSVCGWIVDLRADEGGNMYPMIAGLGALIGEGQLGSFNDAAGETDHWYYRDGQSGIGNETYAKVSQPEFLLDPEATPVAVLIGPQTASSGEATALSFRGRPNTRFFGQPSYGLTTGNDSFPLSDGAVIILTVVTELDRTGQEYSGKIVPDVETTNPQAEATGWLLAQPACNK